MMRSGRNKRYGRRDNSIALRRAGHLRRRSMETERYKFGKRSITYQTPRSI